MKIKTENAVIVVLNENLIATVLCASRYSSGVKGTGVPNSGFLFQDIFSDI